MRSSELAYTFNARSRKNAAGLGDNGQGLFAGAGVWAGRIGPAHLPVRLDASGRCGAAATTERTGFGTQAVWLSSAASAAESDLRLLAESLWVAEKVWALKRSDLSRVKV